MNKLRFTLLGALCALCVPALAVPTYVTVLAGGKVAALPAPAFVGSDGQVYAPVESLRLLGAAWTTDDDTVNVTGASGKTLTLPSVEREGYVCIPLQKATLALGGDADWQPTTQTLALRARLLMVRQDDGQLSIYTSYPVAYAVQSIDKPRRVYVDLYGADLAAVPAAVPQVTYEDAPPSAVARIRSGQIDFNTVRITLDLAQSMAFRVLSAGPSSSRVRVALGDSASLASLPTEKNAPAPNLPAPPSVVLPSASSRPTTVAQTPPAHPTPPRVVVNPPAPVLPPNPSPVRITHVAVNNVSDTLVQVTVAATGPAPYRTETLRGPNRLAFDLAGASLDADVSPALPGNSPIVKAVRSGILHAEKNDFGRVVVDLASLVGFSVSSARSEDGTMLYTISLNLPHSPSSPASPPASLGGANSIAGKIVVVDAGHGVQDTGAIAPDGTREKDINLMIAKKVRDVLTQNGATVFMTREDDSFLPVDARPQFAIAHNADYFLSIHCDASVRGPNTVSGDAVYFHANNPVCRRMAADIATRVAALAGLPNLGPKSDMIQYGGRFQTGYGVLRSSPMPAVLVECGYLNSDSDLAKLKDDAAQQNIAEGIVAGLRDFVADRAAR